MQTIAGAAAGNGQFYAALWKFCTLSAVKLAKGAGLSQIDPLHLRPLHTPYCWQESNEVTISDPRGFIKPFISIKYPIWKNSDGNEML